MIEAVPSGPTLRKRLFTPSAISKLPLLSRAIPSGSIAICVAFGPSPGEAFVLPLPATVVMNPLTRSNLRTIFPKYSAM